MQQSTQIRDQMERYYQLARAGDLEAAESFVSTRDGVIVIGSDPNEWWDGAAYNRAMRVQAQEMGGSIPIYSGEIHAFREGSIGWAVDRPTFRLGDGLEMTGRLSVVLHEEQGEWQIVHLHLSFGLPNEEAFGQELTI